MPRRTTPTPPTLSTLRLPELTAGFPSAIRAHGTYEALSFAGDDLTGMDRSSAGPTGCVIEELDLTGAHAQPVSFEDTGVGPFDVSGATAVTTVVALR